MRKTRDAFKRNMVSIIMSLVLIILFVIFYLFKKPCLVSSGKVDKDSLYNLLTVNTIFAGFLYTMLGNMVEFSSRTEIQEIDMAGYVDSYFSPIYFGLFYFLAAIFIELVIIFFGITLKINLLIYLQQVSTLLGLFYFVVSAFKMRRMINKVRKIN